MGSVSARGWELVDPGLVGRCEWEVEETRRDLEVLAWIGRFRFVTAEALAMRQGVSVQRANARVRRLERLGLVGGKRQHVSQARAVFLTGKGHELLGWERRRAPRAEVHREHEAAIVWLVTQYERRRPHERVLTERECRHLERVGDEHFSVEVSAIHDSVARHDRRRWPDVVIGSGREKQAVEIEFAPKGSKRLRGIVGAYAYSGRYRETVFLVKNAALGRRIQALAPRVPASGRAKLPVRVEAWLGFAVCRARGSEGGAPGRVGEPGRESGVAASCSTRYPPDCTSCREPIAAAPVGA